MVCYFLKDELMCFAIVVTVFLFFSGLLFGFQRERKKLLVKQKKIRQTIQQNNPNNFSPFFHLSFFSYIASDIQTESV